MKFVFVLMSFTVLEQSEAAPWPLRRRRCLERQMWRSLARIKPRNTNYMHSCMHRSPSLAVSYTLPTSDDGTAVKSDGHIMPSKLSAPYAGAASLKRKWILQALQRIAHLWLQCRRQRRHITPHALNMADPGAAHHNMPRRNGVGRGATFCALFPSLFSCQCCNFCPP